jgi:hypothetical protein
MDNAEHNRLNIEEDRKRKREEREATIRRIVMAYKRVFSTEDGQLILEDLTAAFGWKLPVALSTAAKPGIVSYDPLYMAIRAGQHEIYLYIQRKLEAPDFPDGNIDRPIEVLSGLSQ